MDRLKALGVQAVTVAVPFPILYLPYHESRGNGGAAERYAAFYGRLRDEARARGLKIIAETGAVFPSADYSGPGWRGVAAYYRGLSPERFVAGYAANAARAAETLRPAFISVGAEPDTGARIVRQPLGTPEAFAGLVGAAARAVKARKLPATRVGAGVGSWQADWQAYVRRILAEPIDYVDIHVYPINRDFLPRCLEIAAMARAAGRPSAISEAWLLKATDAELAHIDAASDSAVFSRDVYAFWVPLDSRFLRDLVRFARSKRLLFLSPFWSKCFHAYLPWDEATDRLAPGARSAAHLRLVARAIAAGRTTATGRAYRAAITRRP
ncbi:MAG: hypothetical protein IT208_10795 [Chthonomonadales bacterium]|nr:hypothetical protein [Chthonomonadales bacterium]